MVVVVVISGSIYGYDWYFYYVGRFYFFVVLIQIYKNFGLGFFQVRVFQYEVVLIFGLDISFWQVGFVVVGVFVRFGGFQIDVVVWGVRLVWFWGWDYSVIRMIVGWY